MFVWLQLTFSCMALNSTSVISVRSKCYKLKPLHVYVYAANNNRPLNPVIGNCGLRWDR